MQSVPSHQNSANIGIMLVGALLLGAAGVVAWQLYRWLSTDRRYSESNGRARRVGQTAILLVLATGSFAIGLLLQAGLEWAGLGKQSAAADFFLLSSYGLMGLATITIPKVSRGQSLTIQMLVDGLMVITAAVAFSWYFTLGPTISQSFANQSNQLLQTGFPVMDLVVVAGLVLFSSRANSPSVQRMWRPMTMGMSVIVLADSCIQYVSLHGLETPLLWIEIVRVVGFVLLLLASVLAVRSSPTLGEKPEDGPIIVQDTNTSPEVWDPLLPYILVPAMGLLTFNTWRDHSSATIAAGVFASAVVLIGLAFGRQIVAIQENSRLYRRINGAYQESVAFLMSLQSLNDELKITKSQLESKNNDLALANLRLQALATTDPLTGLPNHRSMVAALDQELQRSQRYDRPCSVLFVDLDHFKALNDSMGHLAGDTILRELVNPIVDGLRTVDILGRWGGEEFVVILPETSLADGISAAERIRGSVAKYAFSVGGGGKLSCSIGVATFPYDATNRDELIDAADRAMYAAKRMGRNQVRAAVDPTVVNFMSEIGRRGSREEVALWGTVEAFTTIVRVYDSASDRHSHDVAGLAMRLATSLGLEAPEARIVGLAARLHDIGKIAIPHSILNKEDSLSEADWRTIRDHPTVGAEIVERIPALAMLATAIRSHHEHWDGTGYPDRLATEEIPIGSRIIAVADAYQSMVAGRPYSGPMTPEAALSEVERCAGTQFDPRVADRLRAVLHEDRLLTFKHAG
jgi:diguanylate cyclase (GGDEF)-like protein/putative nucleotidyltransferase with HDIG domain